MLVLKESVRLAKELTADQLPGAVDDLGINLIAVPGARACLDLLEGVRSPEQLARFLRTAGQTLVSDAAAAQCALADWCADRQPPATGRPVDLLKPALVGVARAMMGSAPASVDWGMLGAALAVALPTLALPLRLGLQDAVSCDSLWGSVVQAIWQADAPDVLDTIRLTLMGHLSPEAAVPAWVSQAMAGSAVGWGGRPPLPPPPPRACLWYPPSRCPLTRGRRSGRAWGPLRVRTLAGLGGRSSPGPR